VRSACQGLPFYKEHEGKECVLHYPGGEKSADFKTALRNKLDNKDFNFDGVWFPDEISFAGFNFSAEARFFFATFSASVTFSRATFNATAHFSHVIFKATVRFFAATFNADAHFGLATFSAAADFSFATFSRGAIFTHTTFTAEVDFGNAIFQDYVRFAGSEKGTSFNQANPSLNLQFARMEKPDRISFHTLTLHPHWFTNLDSRKFDFTNVNWSWRSVEAEVHSLNERRISSPYPVALYYLPSSRRQLRGKPTL